MSQLLFSALRRLWMDPSGAPPSFHTPSFSHCCGAMTAALTNVCDAHADDPFACPDMLVCHSPVFNEYGLIVHDGGPSYVTIRHCPFCGSDLGESRRDAWFDALEALGIPKPFDDPDAVPEQYRTAAWWAKEGP